MIISPLEILRLNERYNLVSGLGKRDAVNPEGVGLDLRVGTFEKIVSDSFLPSDETNKKRYSPKTELIASIEKDGNITVTLEPGEYRLITTIEGVHPPKEKIRIKWYLPRMHLMPYIYPRTSLQRGGVVLVKTKTDPGYTGVLTFGLANLAEHPFHFELGARMFNLVFHGVVGDINRPYSGQHQGGRTTSQGKLERQT